MIVRREGNIVVRRMEKKHIFPLILQQGFEGEIVDQKAAELRNLMKVNPDSYFIIEYEGKTVGFIELNFLDIHKKEAETYIQITEETIAELIGEQVIDIFMELCKDYKLFEGLYFLRQDEDGKNSWEREQVV